LDTNGDGVPDVRLGIDNMPATVTGEPGHRAWRTDLLGHRASWIGRSTLVGRPDVLRGDDPRSPWLAAAQDDSPATASLQEPAFVTAGS
jgi:hypothetical protein